MTPRSSLSSPRLGRPHSGLAMHAAVISALLAGLSAARADEATASPAGASIPARRTLTLPGAKLLDERTLAARRGGTDTHLDLQITGNVSNNNASNIVTGNNTIGSGALAGASGVPVVIQNSGNNVLIQSATIVNVVVK